MKMLLFCVIAGILMATSIRGDMPGLNHLLKDFQFEIPEIDQGDLTIKSFICKDISFGNVGYVLSFFSSFFLRKRPRTTNILQTHRASGDFALDVSGVTAQCDGSLKYGIVTFGFHDLSLTLGNTKFDNDDSNIKNGVVT